MLYYISINPGNMQKNDFFNRILPFKRYCKNIFEKIMKNLESAYKKLPVKMNAINEYVHVLYLKIKEGLNCFLSLPKLTYHIILNIFIVPIISEFYF